MSTNTPNHQRRGAITEREFNVACEVYANTGSKHAAILSISGGATDAEGRPSRRRTLEHAIATNPAWAARWADAGTLALGRVEQAIADAAFRIDTRPIFDKAGKLLGVQQDSRPSNDMLKFMARKLSPEWRETKNLQVEGSIDHKHGPSDGFGVFVSANDVLYLDGEDRAKFMELLTLIRNRRTPENPNVIDQPATRSVRQLDSGREGDAST